jgi:hypothetical protein
VPLDVGEAGAEENMVEEPEEPEEEPDDEEVVVVLLDELSGVLEGVGVLDPLADELVLVGSSTYVMTMRISSHCSPIDRSYRLKKSPLPHFHHLVEPPIASDELSHTEKPPV